MRFQGILKQSRFEAGRLLIYIESRLPGLISTYEGNCTFTFCFHERSYLFAHRHSKRRLHDSECPPNFRQPSRAAL
jgi:hypothetical protein